IRLLYRDTRFQFSISKRSFLSTFLVGSGFALGWSPCIGPILATILTIAGSRDFGVSECRDGIAGCSGKQFLDGNGAAQLEIWAIDDVFAA
ncbi:MAG: hypothetical protein IIA27_15250, partial [Gemmatimonadetes bacterium]|nr:hypothetical protein [Gemmatimonadota bacterium]